MLLRIPATIVVAGEVAVRTTVEPDDVSADVLRPHAVRSSTPRSVHSDNKRLCCFFRAPGLSILLIRSSFCFCFLWSDTIARKDDVFPVRLVPACINVVTFCFLMEKGRGAVDALLALAARRRGARHPAIARSAPGGRIAGRSVGRGGKRHTASCR